MSRLSNGQSGPDRNSGASQDEEMVVVCHCNVDYLGIYLLVLDWKPIKAKLGILPRALSIGQFGCS